MKYFSFLVLLFFSTSSFCQESDKTKIINLLKKSQQVFDGLKTYYFESDYKLYVNQTSNEVKESYTGVTIKKDILAYSKIATTEFVVLNDFNLKIDNNSKRMQISTEKFSENASLNFDVKKYLNHFVNFKLIELDNQYKCELRTDKITSIPYSKVIIYIDKKSNRMQKQELYFLTKHKTKLVNGKPYYDYPRLEIVISNFKVDGFESDSFFKKESYLLKNKGTYIPAKKYKEYTIVD